jgi:hypothetical protein
MELVVLIPGFCDFGLGGGEVGGLEAERLDGAEDGVGGSLVQRKGLGSALTAAREARIAGSDGLRGSGSDSSLSIA